MKRKQRLLLNKIAPCFTGFKNVESWEERGDHIIVITKNGYYTAKNYFGTYGFITKHI